MKKIFLTVLFPVLLIVTKAYASTEWASNFNNASYICSSILTDNKTIKLKKKIKLEFFYKTAQIDFDGETSFFDATNIDNTYRLIVPERDFYLLFNREKNTLLSKSISTKKVNFEYKFLNCVDVNKLD